MRRYIVISDVRPLESAPTMVAEGLTVGDVRDAVGDAGEFFLIAPDCDPVLVSGVDLAPAEADDLIFAEARGRWSGAGRVTLDLRDGVPWLTF